MKTYIDPEEITLLENVTINLRDKLLVRLLFRLGCRVSEALDLKVTDIDFTNSTVTIKHLKSHLKLACPNCEARLGVSHSFCPKCGGKLDKVISQVLEHRRQRVLPVDNETLGMLQNYIRRGGPITRGDQRLIFGINRHRAWQIVKECAERAKVSKLVNPETGRVHNVSPHRLRDAFAVHAVKLNDSGDGLRLLQEHLGHTSFNTTARYRKVSGEEHRDWYARLWSNGSS